MHDEDDHLSLLESQKNRLDESQRIAERSEMIGAHVLNDLKRQREAIERNLTSLQRADEELDSSDRTLNQMLRRIMTNKLLMYIIGTLTAICLLYLLYRKLWK